MAPTPEDMARDLLADLATCDAASPLPWHYWIAKQASASQYESHGDVIGPRKVQVDRSVMLSPEDATFIGCARYGWPVAIRRAIAAELRVKELEATIEARDSNRVTFVIDEERRMIVTTRPQSPRIDEWDFAVLDRDEAFFATIRERAKECPGGYDAAFLAARDELIRRGMLEAKS